MTMGTRSVTTIRSRWSDQEKFKDHANVYRHWDGYLSGHGKWLADFLDGMNVGNGRIGVPSGKTANGAGSLAAMLVAKLQEDGHNPDILQGPCDCGQEFHYIIDVDMGPCDCGQECAIFATVLDGPITFFGMGGEECVNEVFKGSVSEFIAFIESSDLA